VFYANDPVRTLNGKPEGRLQRFALEFFIDTTSRSAPRADRTARGLICRQSRGGHGAMREIWRKLRENRKIVGTAAAGLLLWAFVQAWEGALEGSGWGPKQLAEKYVGKWFAGTAEKGKLETGSIPQAPTPAKPEPSDAQKKEAAVRAARRARCEKERQADLLEAEKVLAIYWDRARNCIEERKIYLLTRANPEAHCTTQITTRDASEARRDVIATRKC
jgi:hypothetical protein